MSDDQGDADFEAGLAGLAAGRQRRGAGDPGSSADGGWAERALDDVRQSLDELGDRLSGLEQRLDQATSDLGVVQRRLGGGGANLVEQIQDQLADVASGEVVGALWEEVRAVRDALPEAAVDTGDAEELRASVDALRAEVEGIAAALATTTDDRLGPLTDELTALRTELTEGLVVEPSDALSTSLDALRAEVDAVRDALAGAQLAEPPAPAADPAAGTAALQDDLAAVRAGIDQVQARLDEGLELAGGIELPVPDERRFDDLAEQVSALRDLVTAELGGLREMVAAAAVPPPVEPVAPTAVGIDDETVELLREEIRLAGAVPDQLVDALRDELKALRRRIAVKASEKVLDDEQLAQIADAVAARLAAD